MNAQEPIEAAVEETCETANIPQLTRRCGLAKAEGAHVMKANVDQPKTSDSKPVSKPDAKDDLKTLPMPEVEKKLGSSPDGLSSSRGAETADPIWTQRD